MRIRFPITLALLTIAIAFGQSHLLAYDRAAIANGELWRIVTCQWTHFSTQHLFWDGLALLILGAMAEREDRRSFLRVVACSAIALPLVVHFTSPAITIFRGLSGIDTALFGLVVTNLCARAIRQRSSRDLWLPLAASLVLVGKTAYEMLTGGGTVFVDNAAGGFVAVPIVHLAGLSVGITVGVLRHAGAACRFDRGPEVRYT